MITRLKLSTIEQGLPKYRSMLAGNPAYQPTSFESIASATGTGSAGTITFSSIPSTYQHLQLRFNILSATNFKSIYVRINGDTTAANNRFHSLYGATSTVGATSNTSTNGLQVLGFYNGTTSSYPNVGIVDIHDYNSTTKNKTIRSIVGQNDNTGGSDEIALTSGLWISTSAVTSVTLYCTDNFTTSSTVSLYGIKG